MWETKPRELIPALRCSRPYDWPAKFVRTGVCLYNGTWSCCVFGAPDRRYLQTAVDAGHARQLRAGALQMTWAGLLAGISSPHSPSSRCTWAPVRRLIVLLEQHGRCGTKTTSPSLHPILHDACSIARKLRTFASPPAPRVILLCHGGTRRAHPSRKRPRSAAVESPCHSICQRRLSSPPPPAVVRAAPTIALAPTLMLPSCSPLRRPSVRAAPTIWLACGSCPSGWTRLVFVQIPMPSRWHF
ncbi:hypothetical protein BU23DRAFT_329245 [Bimuria novae-zelandiae CBS 107.79]|uniref:Uncharacterized protein n=1 Tax=Bimuria novae-zelandiae CBS 107.79 TaxID=1447943 RepID=A0A6A5ULW8_9PLEO|nr:hypothetical protein BU23DRAFT_329245 [Bimuria novae-zelandiae CBS 107.79]